MRVTSALVRVLHAILETPTERQWGYDLSRRTGLRSGVLYPILRRMHEEGWLTDGWEDPAETHGRPSRRYYELTGEGRVEIARVMSKASGEARFIQLVPGWAR